MNENDYKELRHDELTIRAHGAAGRVDNLRYFTASLFGGIERAISDGYAKKW